MAAPEPRDWEALAESDPWSVICDALLWEKAGVEHPEALTESATKAAMLLTSLALINTGEYDLDSLEPIWDRDWSAFFEFDPATEALSVRIVFEDDEEPGVVTTTGRGLGGVLRQKFADIEAG